LLLVSLTVAGCGSHITGNLPPVTGKVHAAGNPEQAIVGATVILTAANGQVLETTTDERGEFRFDHVPTPNYTLRVEPPGYVPGGPPPTDFQVQEIEVRDEEGFVSDLAIGLPAAEGGQPPPGTELEGLRIWPPEVTLDLAAQSPPFQFQLLLDGQPLTDVRPVWTVIGDVGRIDGQGRFTPTQVGRGKVVAWVDEQWVVALVHVRRSPPPGAGVRPSRAGRGGPGPAAPSELVTIHLAVRPPAHAPAGP